MFKNNKNLNVVPSKQAIAFYTDPKKNSSFNAIAPDTET